MDVYREEILEHWRNPQNWGVIKGADIVIDQVNPLCGDEVTFYFRIKKGKVESTTFIGKGCAISVASASILSEEIKGKRVKELERITGRDIIKSLGGTVAPARLKCAFLPLEAIRKLTNGQKVSNNNRS